MGSNPSAQDFAPDHSDSGASYVWKLIKIAPGRRDGIIIHGGLFVVGGRIVFVKNVVSSMFDFVDLFF